MIYDDMIYDDMIYDDMMYDYMMYDYMMYESFYDVLACCFSNKILIIIIIRCRKLFSHHQMMIR